jgi:hypothetical protein
LNYSWWKCVILYSFVLDLYSFKSQDVSWKLSWDSPYVEMYKFWVSSSLLRIPFRKLNRNTWMHCNIVIFPTAKLTVKHRSTSEFVPHSIFNHPYFFLFFSLFMMADGER